MAKTTPVKKTYKIQDFIIFYENYKVKINGKWYFITKEKLKIALLKNATIVGKIVGKRTRTWVE